MQKELFRWVFLNRSRKKRLSDEPRDFVGVGCLPDVRLGFAAVAPEEPRCPTGNAHSEHGESEREPPLPRDEPAEGAQHA